MEDVEEKLQPTEDELEAAINYLGRGKAPRQGQSGYLLIFKFSLPFRGFHVT